MRLTPDSMDYSDYYNRDYNRHIIEAEDMKKQTRSILSLLNPAYPDMINIDKWKENQCKGDHEKYICISISKIGSKEKTVGNSSQERKNKQKSNDHDYDDRFFPWYILVHAILIRVLERIYSFLAEKGDW